MRVLHVTSSFPRFEGDPTGTFVADLVAASAAAGLSVRVVAPSAPGAAAVITGVPVRRFAASQRLAYRGGLLASARSPRGAAMVPPYLASMLASVRSEVRAWRPDVIHAHWWFPAGFVSVMSSVPTVITLHGSDVGLAARVGPLARAVARRVSAVVAVSDALAREATAVLGVPVGVASMPVVVAPTARHRGGGPLLAVGRLSPEKGFDVLAAASARAGVPVSVIGAGPSLDTLQRAGLIVEAPVDRASLHERIADASALVVPSRREGLGLVALEALLIGTPVIASHVGGLPAVMGYTGPPPDRGCIVHAPGGLLVPADDVEALALALASPPGPPTPVASSVTEFHRPDVVAARHLALYEEAMAKRRRGSHGPGSGPSAGSVERS